MTASRARALMITSNGAGMGHLTRQLAVALASSDVLSATLFSLSVALPVVAGHGVPGEYCPSVERKWMPSRMWHGYLCERIVALAAETEAQAIVFDGVAPYPGILAARSKLRNVAFVWIRRGMWRRGVNVAQLRKAAFFDQIIEPGDLASRADGGPTAGRDDALRVPPISMLDVIPRLDRASAADQLGIDPDRPTVLVTLGSGRLGEVEAPGAVVVDALLEDRDWQICVTKAAIAQRSVPLRDEGRVVELRGVYPLVRYLDAFDAVVSAAGYNAVHEFLPAALPTLLVPNPATRTDDQVGRAETVAARGLALSALPDASADLAAAVRRLADATVRTDLTGRCRELGPDERGGGAAATGNAVADLATTTQPRSPSLGQRLAWLDTWGRETAKRVLGVRGTDLVRRALGRTYDDLEHTLPVFVEGSAPVTGAEPLIIGEDIAAERIRSGGPAEHVLPGTSAGYLQRRREIVDEYYDVRSG